MDVDQFGIVQELIGIKKVEAGLVSYLFKKLEQDLLY
jgi:hypothetical protein